MLSVHVENSFSDKALSYNFWGVPQGSILGPLLFLPRYVNDMVQAIYCDLLLYADETGLIFNIRTLIYRTLANWIEIFQISATGSWITSWVFILLSEDRAKSILAPLNKCKKLHELNISYGSLKIKQYHLEVTYLGCILDESLSGESMVLNVVSKINTHLKFLYQKNIFVTSMAKY